MLCDKRNLEPREQAELTLFIEIARYNSEIRFILVFSDCDRHSDKN